MTSSPPIWPPSTDGMSADQIAELRQIAMDLLVHINGTGGPYHGVKGVLFDQCSKEGHKFGPPKRDSEQRGYPEENEYTAYFEQIACTRCRCVVQKDCKMEQVITSPFVTP